MRGSLLESLPVVQATTGDGLDALLSRQKEEGGNDGNQSTYRGLWPGERSWRSRAPVILVGAGG